MFRKIVVESEIVRGIRSRPAGPLDGANRRSKATTARCLLFFSFIIHTPSAALFSTSPVPVKRYYRWHLSKAITTFYFLSRDYRYSNKSWSTKMDQSLNWTLINDMAANLTQEQRDAAEWRIANAGKLPMQNFKVIVTVV